MNHHSLSRLSVPPEALLEDFHFESVKVNPQGEIVEKRMSVAKQYHEELGNGVILEIVSLPGGSFRMGSRPMEGTEDERPQHFVNLEPFLISKYPVTQEQWATIMNWTPPYRFQGKKRPVDRVSWDQTQEFCQKLSLKTGHNYRLPSETEWEYACRVGTSTAFYFGETITTDLANYVGEHTYLSGPKGIYRHQTTDAGSFPPNAFGIYDLGGNVWEWCLDAWHDNYQGAPADGSPWEIHGSIERVVRGGCWHDPPNLCRSASRLKFVAKDPDDFIGFRLALSSLDIVAVPETRAPDSWNPLNKILSRIRARGAKS
ncbi:MAG TPA: formylglycine-generating enzyme family protein [Bacillota bacterium]|nr:formylglycine-generating enzyme family protein [Bacillota bacterium]